VGGVLTTAHSDEDISFILEAAGDSLEAVTRSEPRTEE
jgi:hypothetical protein